MKGMARIIVCFVPMFKSFLNRYDHITELFEFPNSIDRPQLFQISSFITS